MEKCEPYSMACDEKPTVATSLGTPYYYLSTLCVVIKPGFGCSQYTSNRMRGSVPNIAFFTMKFPTMSDVKRHPYFFLPLHPLKVVPGGSIPTSFVSSAVLVIKYEIQRTVSPPHTTKTFYSWSYMLTQQPVQACLPHTIVDTACCVYGLSRGSG